MDELRFPEDCDEYDYMCEAMDCSECHVHDEIIEEHERMLAEERID